MTDFRKLLPYIRPHFHLLVVALVLLVLSGALETFLIMLLAPIFNQLSTVAGIESGGEDKFAFLHEFLGLDSGNLVQIAFLLVAFSLFKGVFLYFAEYSMSYSGQQVVASLRKHLYEHLLDQSLAFYGQNPTGQLMARVVTDTERIQETVSKTLTDFIRQVLLLFLFLGLVFLHRMEAGPALFFDCAGGACDHAEDGAKNASGQPAQPGKSGRDLTSASGDHRRTTHRPGLWNEGV